MHIFLDSFRDMTSVTDWLQDSVHVVVQTYNAISSPKASVLLQRLCYCRNLSSEIPGDSEYLILHWEDVLVLPSKVILQG